MKRVLILVIAVGCLLLAWGGTAFAATSQDIYNDYAADGHLDGNYTDAELRAYLSDATLHQYGDQAMLSQLDTLAHSTLTSGRGGFPFTGAQLALMGLAALALVGAGFGLRRLVRSRS